MSFHSRGDFFFFDVFMNSCNIFWKQNKEVCELNKKKPALTETDTNISRTLKYCLFMHVVLSYLCLFSLSTMTDRATRISFEPF